MALLSDQDREAVRARLAPITHRVTLLLFTQTFGGPETGPAAKQIVDEIASLNDLIAVDEANFVLDKDRAATHGVDRIPAIVVLRDGEDTRMRFFGAPEGYEFMSLLEAVTVAGVGDSGLTPESRSLIAEQVSTPIDIKVFVTPSCPHCPRVVTLAHRMAAESTHVTAACIEATEFFDLSQQYRVTGVPKTVINDSVEILGAVSEEEFVQTAVGNQEERPSGPA